MTKERFNKHFATKITEFEVIQFLNDLTASGKSVENITRDIDDTIYLKKIDQDADDSYFEINVDNEETRFVPVEELNNVKMYEGVHQIYNMYRGDILDLDNLFKSLTAVQQEAESAVEAGFVSPEYKPYETSREFNISSPIYMPQSPEYNPTTPGYNPVTPEYNPTTTKYSYASPDYTPTPNVFTFDPSNPSDPNYEQKIKIEKTQQELDEQKKMKEKIDAELESIRKELALTKQEIQTFPDRPPTPSYL